MKRLFPLLFLLAACGPVSLQQAERACFDRARLAQQPRGSVGVGVNSNGQTSGVLDLQVSTDFLQGRDPSAVYDQCVFQKSGLAPSQPLYSRSDWKS
jgi:hypothetical protein